MSNLIAKRCISSALLLFLIAFAAHADPEAINGRVHHADGDTLDVCFDDATRPTVGDKLTVVHHEIAPPNAKAVPMIRSSEVGTVEIVSAVDSGGCAKAHLVSGKAVALDWVALQQ